jgi:uncharacterized protein HemX
MSDETSSRDQQSADDAVDPSSAAEADAGDVVQRAGRRPASRTGWLALAVALAALGLATRPFWPPAWPGAPADRAPADSRLQALAKEVSTLDTAVADLETAVASARDAFAQRAQSLGERIDSLAGRTEERSRSTGAFDDRLQSLSRRLDRLETEQNSALGSLDGRLDEFERRLSERLQRFEVRLDELAQGSERGDRARETRMRLLTIDRLVSAALYRLRLGDIESARQLWQWVVDETEALDDARFGSLREAVNSDMQRLRDHQREGVREHVQRLLEMAEAVEGWPTLIADGAGAQASPDDVDTDAGEAEGWQGRVADVFGRLVQVESIDPERPGLAEIARARSTVRARLETAALALARGDRSVASALTEAAADDLERAFDTDDGSVASALAWLRGLALSAPADPPDLSATREQLQGLLAQAR